MAEVPTLSFTLEAKNFDDALPLGSELVEVYNCGVVQTL